ncbi:MAG: UTRA domain-containing protein, partial [Bacillota bacterium]
DYIQSTLKLKITQGKQKIYATFANETYQRYMEIGPYTPIIHLELTGYLDDGRIFEYTNSYKNSERYELVITSRQ